VEPKGSLQCQQEPATGPHHKLGESHSYPHSFLTDPFTSTLLSILQCLKLFPPLMTSVKRFVHIYTFPVHATRLTYIAYQCRKGHLHSPAGSGSCPGRNTHRSHSHCTPVCSVYLSGPAHIRHSMCPPLCPAPPSATHCPLIILQHGPVLGYSSYYTGCIKMIGTVSICHYEYQNVRRSKFPTWNETAGVYVLCACACAIPLPSSLSVCDVTKR